MMNMPFVTVIMPIRNEEAYIEKSLGSVLAQDYPPDRMEIIIADGMSTDQTRDIIRSYQQQHSNIVLIDNPQQIVPTGFNRAVKQAKGEVIVRVDGHCEIPLNYIQTCVKQLAETKADCVGGTLNTIGETRMAKAIAAAQSSPFGVGGVSFRVGSNKGKYVDTLAFGAYHRDVFDRIGLFDEELVRNQDDEFNFRLIQAGGKIWLDPSIKSIYYSRASLRTLWKQYYQYGLYKVRVIQKRGQIPSWRHLVPVCFVVGLIVTLSGFVITQHIGWLVPVVIPYVIANLITSIIIARQQWGSLFWLPLIFFVLHFSYGWGFLVGLWKWRHYFGATKRS
ncbi:MAG: glycosyltransferase family 2 protein [Gemmatimonadetes bacterium]|nr:MAG: glycosyltransferase family 2 protein [Gemmatimonadota bacterium]